MNGKRFVIVVSIIHREKKIKKKCSFQVEKSIKCAGTANNATFSDRVVVV